MSLDKENMLELFENFKAAIVKLMEERDKLATEADEIRGARREAEEKAWQIEEDLKEAKTELIEKEKVIRTTEAEKVAAEAKIDELTKEIEDLKSDTSKEDQLAKVTAERDELKKEMDEITSKLERVSELYRETTAEKEKLAEKVDVSDLLGIYITLIETVFGGKPHARVLYTLHNTQTAIPRKNLEKSTGIMPTAILKAIHDLRNAGLVDYDEESQEVKLLKDIL
ncbi:MAG: hypothetical protein BAJATHORv1_30156 [Candidatus Thorarchaeota archaeon]|nr:MAG: hypothetical protein BAJATHORv1_30156 [Candidatus Thorarchaeota archaeon]